MRRYLLYFAVAILAFGISVFTASEFFWKTEEPFVIVKKGEEIKSVTWRAQKQDDTANKSYSDNPLIPVSENPRKPLVIKGGGEICEDYLLKKIAKEKAKGSRIVKLKAFNISDETHSTELKKWFETIHEDMLVTFELRHKEEKGFIFRANIANATDIAANFTSWHIQSNTHSITFRSLSENPKLIFWDKAGLLNYYSIDYGSTFLEKGRDWDNLTLDLLRYRINLDGKSQLVSEEQNVKCK